MTYLIGYIDIAVIKFTMYITNAFGEQIVAINSQWFHVFIHDHGTDIHENTLKVSLKCLCLLFTNSCFPE
jgi:hypothetical protein